MRYVLPEMRYLPVTHLGILCRFMPSAYTDPEVPVSQNILTTMCTRLPVNR
jgi:hypothetical protein